MKTLFWLIAIVAAVGAFLWLKPSSTPSARIPAGWVTSTTTAAAFAYPPALGTTYIGTVDWPPALQLLDQAYSCTQAGTPQAQAGQTAERTIHGHTYCVTDERQGATGSIYDSYAYAFAAGGKLAIFTFSLRTPQCVNYPEPKQSECAQEVSHLDVDTIVDQMAQTLKVP